mgnify:CR=1 FL=1
MVLEVESGTLVKDLLENQDVPVEEVIVAVDGKIVSKSRKLENVETVRVMQVVAGG